MIDPNVATIATTIENARNQSGKIFLSSSELIALCSRKELDEMINAEEVAAILTAMAGRKISADYVKLLRLQQRLPAAKQVSKRAYLYRMRDAFFVTFNEKHKISDSV